MVRENLIAVEEKIREACARAGRNREDVTLICVTKTKPVEMLEEAYAAGQRNFGENKVQEICLKAPQLPEDIRWHMIGHLQRNKVKQVMDKAVMIHSVDNLRLAETISREAVKRNMVMPILIEVNAAGEESKFGIALEETEQLVRQAAALPGLQIAGLMTLSVDIKSKCIDNVTMDHLSMGMTGDYQVAIEEGATLIRVGTGIFGERNYV